MNEQAYERYCAEHGVCNRTVYRLVREQLADDICKALRVNWLTPSNRNELEAVIRRVVDGPAPPVVTVVWFGYEIPEAHAKDASLSPNYCPACRTRGGWRRGVHFEHQMICSCRNESTIWCPDDIEQARAKQAEASRGTGGDGI